MGTTLLAVRNAIPQALYWLVAAAVFLLAGWMQTKIGIPAHMDYRPSTAWLLTFVLFAIGAAITYAESFNQAVTIYTTVGVIIWSMFEFVLLSLYNPVLIALGIVVAVFLGHAARALSYMFWPPSPTEERSDF